MTSGESFRRGPAGGLGPHGESAASLDQLELSDGDAARALAARTGNEATAAIARGGLVMGVEAQMPSDLGAAEAPPALRRVFEAAGEPS